MKRALTIGLATLFLGGCVEFADSFVCSDGLILDENDQCVLPPVADGGIGSCADLCAQFPEWSESRRQCLLDTLGAFGSPPPECTAPTTLEMCIDCINAANATDAQCVGVPSICPETD